MSKCRVLLSLGAPFYLGEAFLENKSSYCPTLNPAKARIGFLEEVFSLLGARELFQTHW